LALNVNPSTSLKKFSGDQLLNVLFSFHFLERWKQTSKGFSEKLKEAIATRLKDKQEYMILDMIYMRRSPHRIGAKDNWRPDQKLFGSPRFFAGDLNS
jgi:hypothetical protein